MKIQYVQVACPNCSRSLRVRLQTLRKRGRCRFCGHEFRAGMIDAVDDSPTPAGSRPQGPGPDLETNGVNGEDLGHLVQTLEREYQQTWDHMAAQQASVLQGLISGMGGQVPSREQARGQLLQALASAPRREKARAQSVEPMPEEPSQFYWAVEPDSTAEDPPAAPAPVESRDPRFQVARSIVSPSAPAPQVVEEESLERGQEAPIVEAAPCPSADRDEAQAVNDVPPIPSADVAERLDRLARERDEARGECERLRAEADALRADQAGRLAEIAQLRKSSERLEAIRAERGMLGREAARLQARHVALQVALVEAEAELDDSRNRARAELDESESRHRGFLAEATRQFDEHRNRFEHERQAWRVSLEAHRRVEHEAAVLRMKVKKIRGLYDVMRQQRDATLQQVQDLQERVEILSQRSGRLSAYLEESESERRAAERGHQVEIERLVAALNGALGEAESPSHSLATRFD